MAGALDQCAVELSADSAERAALEPLTGGMRELARLAHRALLPTP